MNRAGAAALLGATAAATFAAFALPAPVTLALLAIGVAVMRRRRAFLALAAVGALVNGALLALLLAGPGLEVAGIGFSQRGAVLGLTASLRLAAALAVNLALLSRVPAPRLLDALRLPPGPTAFLAAVFAVVHAVGRDAADLVAAARLDGDWPTGRLRQAAATARLLPNLLVLALRHGDRRRDALRLAGHETGPRFAAVVAITALAAAGRMATLAVPNDPVAYAVVFLGGLLFGARVGALAGCAAMAVTDLLLSGVLPAAFANVPAMAAVGALGGLVGRFGLVAPLPPGGDDAGHDAGRARAGAAAAAAVAAACGVLAVLLFSVLADVGTWLLVPEYRGDPEALAALVAAGLAFNLLPAAAAAVLFALAIGPVARAAAAAGIGRHASIAPDDRDGSHVPRVA